MEINENLYEKYNQYADSGFEWQEECLNEIQDKNNVIISSPTGSGKTRVFLEWAKGKEERPIIITAPIKALSNQRYRELLEAGFVVGLETGDIKSVPENCEFLCCTQEIYTNKYAEVENETFIMDEFHYIFESPDRARIYYEGETEAELIENALVVAFSRREIQNILDKLADIRYTMNRGKSPEECEQIEELAKENEYDDSYDYEQDEGYYVFDEDYEESEETIKLRKELMAKKEEYDRMIPRVYFDEFSPEDNCRIFANILCGTSPDIILGEFAPINNFYKMLQFRKYVMSLPKEY